MSEIHPGPGIGNRLQQYYRPAGEVKIKPAPPIDPANVSDITPHLVQIGWWNPKSTPQFFVYGGGPGDVPVYVEEQYYVGKEKDLG